MVWGWCRSMIRSWGWGMVWGRCRNWGMVRCRSWSMVWLMWYMAECCEWNWMFICRYCRYHSHNCGKENLKLIIIFAIALNVNNLHNILGLYTNILIIINATFIFGMSVITFYNTNLMEYICYNNSRLLPNYNWSDGCVDWSYLPNCTLYLVQMT